MKKHKFLLIVLCCIVACCLVGCVQNPEVDNTEGESENVENIGAEFEVDLTKISPMIQENVNEDVVVAAKNVIEAFLRYENRATIKVSGN